MYEVDEETNEVKLAEEFAIPGTQELNSLEVWGHKHPILLKAGRCSHVAPGNMAEEEKEEYMAKLAEEDKVEERYRALNEDNAYPGLEIAWTTKITGDT